MVCVFLTGLRRIPTSAVEILLLCGLELAFGEWKRQHSKEASTVSKYLGGYHCGCWFGRHQRMARTVSP